MIDETQFTYRLKFDASMYNASGAIYPGAYQRLITRMMEAHLDNIEMDVPRLIRTYNLAWAMLEMSLEIKRPIHPDEQLTGKTWHAACPLPLYRREFMIRDEQGEPVILGTSYSTLLDLTKRRICTNASILSTFTLPDGEPLLEADSRFRGNLPFYEVEKRRVRPSFLDGLGHVNNARYGEFVYDALTDAEREKIGGLRRLDAWFLGELKAGMSFDMERAEQDGAVFLRGLIQPEGKPSFIMKLTF